MTTLVDGNTIYKACDCGGWKLSEPQLQGFTMLAHYHGMKYTGTRFRFCPWCGKELDWKESQNSECDEAETYL